MRLAPLDLKDPMSARVARDPNANSQLMQRIPSDAVVKPSVVELLHHGEELKSRPYLHIQGRIEELRPTEQELPYGISQLPFKSGEGPILDAYYEFTDDQLSQMVAKGYFSEEFTVPSQMSSVVWDLPVDVDYLMVYPEYIDEIPVVFAGVHDRSSLVLTETTSGYDLHNYFQDVSSDREVGVEEELETSQHEIYSGDRANIFADMDYGQQKISDEPSVETAPAEVSTSTFEALMAEAQADQQKLQGEYEDQLRQDPHSARSLYDSLKIDQATPSQTAETLAEVASDEFDVAEGETDQPSPSASLIDFSQYDSDQEGTPKQAAARAAEKADASVKDRSSQDSHQME